MELLLHMLQHGETPFESLRIPTTFFFEVRRFVWSSQFHYRLHHILIPPEWDFLSRKIPHTTTLTAGSKGGRKGELSWKWRRRANKRQISDNVVDCIYLLQYFLILSLFSFSLSALAYISRNSINCSSAKSAL